MTVFQQMMNWYCNSVGWNAFHNQDSTVIPFQLADGREKNVVIIPNGDDGACVAIPSDFIYDVDDYISEEFLDIFRQRNVDIKQYEGINFDVWDLVESDDSKGLWVSFSFQYERLRAENFQELVNAFLNECSNMEESIFEAIQEIEQQQSSYHQPEAFHQSNEIDWGSVLKKGYDIFEAVVKLDEIFDIF